MMLNVYHVLDNEIESPIGVQPGWDELRPRLRQRANVIGIRYLAMCHNRKVLLKVETCPWSSFSYFYPNLCFPPQACTPDDQSYPMVGLFSLLVRPWFVVGYFFYFSFLGKQWPIAYGLDAVRRGYKPIRHFSRSCSTVKLSANSIGFICRFR